MNCEWLLRENSIRKKWGGKQKSVKRERLVLIPNSSVGSRKSVFEGSGGGRRVLHPNHQYVRTPDYKLTFIFGITKYGREGPNVANVPRGFTPHSPPSVALLLQLAAPLQHTNCTSPPQPLSCGAPNLCPRTLTADTPLSSAQRHNITCAADRAPPWGRDDRLQGRPWGLCLWCDCSVGLKTKNVFKICTFLIWYLVDSVYSDGFCLFWFFWLGLVCSSSIWFISIWFVFVPFGLAWV